MRNPGIAIVGAGFIGPLHVEALRRLGLPVAGILASSPDKGRAAADALGLPRSFHSYEELLDDSTVQVVHLATPNRFHFDQCRRALAAGKHVVCEKPLAMSSVETADLVELARRTPRVTAVNYNIRFYPLCAEARQRVADGQLGEIYQITGSYEQDWLLHETDFNWRIVPEEGGALRAVADIGTHWLDLVTWISGLKVERICADLQTVIPIRQRPKTAIETFQGKLTGLRDTEPVAVTTEDYGSALLQFHGGARGCFTVSQVTAGRKNSLRFEIAGSKQSLAWNSERPNEMWIGHRDQPNQVLLRDPALMHASARKWAATPGGHNEGFADTFKQLFRAVYSAIERAGNATSRNYPTFEDGHREVLLCETILKSHQEHRWVDVNAGY
jgi:predicted dehydrogenase